MWRVAFSYALRVWSLLICAVKSSTKRFAAFGVGAKSGAGRRAAKGEKVSAVVTALSATRQVPGGAHL